MGLLWMGPRLERPGVCLLSVTCAPSDPYRLCGTYPPSYNLTFLSSQNVLLVTLITNSERRHPGFEATFFQLPRLSSKEGPGGAEEGQV